MRKRNRGSATVEITLLMPMILLVTVLCISLLLGEFEQVKKHMELVVYGVTSEIMGEGESDTWLKQLGNPEIKQREDNLLKVYYSQGEGQWVKGYGISYQAEYKMRDSNSIEKIRRWQLLGDIVSK